MMNKFIRAGYSSRLIIMLAAGIVGLALFLTIQRPAQAGTPASPPTQKPDNGQCLACHSQGGQSTKFASGEIHPLTIQSADFDQSVHANVSCQVCHTNISGFPHPQNSAQNQRDYTLEYKDTCKQCHPAISAAIQDSVHTKLGEAGNKNAPICADCHNPHTQKVIKKDSAGNPAGSENATIANVCAKCHNAIYQEYAQSVHGKGVLQDNNPDVPACTNCHGVHQIADPTQVAFRLSSIQLCAKCHTDAARMGKYGLSTQVLNTYVADFHGTTVTLFQKQNPDEQTNKPVCFDCHGVHNITNINDPQRGLKIKQNMLMACQKCHPDATINFPDSWLSHYIPDRNTYPLVYYVGLFYKIFIPTVLGGMAIFVVSDIFRRISDRIKKSARPQ